MSDYHHFSCLRPTVRGYMAWQTCVIYQFQTVMSPGGGEMQLVHLHYLAMTYEPLLAKVHY
jgi:hypothetical protein